MKLVNVFLFVSAFALVFADNKTTTTEPITSTTTARTTTTSTAKTTTLIPTTTGKPEPTTKPDPKTTTKPTTTTSKPLTTTSIPPPVPDIYVAQDVDYNITIRNETANSSYNCFMGTFKTDLKFEYNTTENQEKMAFIGLTNSSTVDESKSKCGENETVLVININDKTTSTLWLTFSREDKSYSLNDIELKMNPSDFAKVFVNTSDTKEFKANLTNADLFKSNSLNSYLCKTNVSGNMDATSEVYKVSISMSDVKLDAFRKEDDKQSYRKEIECDADDQFSDFVPIAVGVALAALVVIVLIAYFIGRRRSRQMSYQSV